MSRESSRSAQVLYAIAIAPQPVTVSEIVDWIVDVDRSNVAHRCRDLHRDGYLRRRRRQSGQIGSNPYEYVIAYPDEEVAQP